MLTVSPPAAAAVPLVACLLDAQQSVLPQPSLPTGNPSLLFCPALQADNPGTWLLHCHILWHQYMGQVVTFAEAVDRVGAPPAGLPQCPQTCTYNTAPWVSGRRAAGARRRAGWNWLLGRPRLLHCGSELLVVRLLAGDSFRQEDLWRQWL